MSTRTGASRLPEWVLLQQTTGFGQPGRPPSDVDEPLGSREGHCWHAQVLTGYQKGYCCDEQPGLGNREGLRLL
ncbi:hypothetical protein KDU71_19220 [Carboxylicivirga sediminis]|uniref:Uncharacterized protein n=1 Tax=Carboxylicivirga sediminis TaxID=2006564 RepID=A0A941FAT6_9BACT|nr:hypothetical protein [Carboxylicivirga sediminis]MBR8537710.1 hypothetical protein [Carboxylicivirga sediminis]